MNFEKFVGQRLRFTGMLESYRYTPKRWRNKKTHRVLTFKHVYVDGELFRDHVHIIISRGMWHLLHTTNPEPFGKHFTFTAELYNYTRKPKKQEIGRTYGIGLRNIAKITKIEKGRNI